jgi:hypothetical protein
MLLANRHFDTAECLLLEARARAATDRDSEALQVILSELVELYCVMEPPRLDLAERCSLEREHLARTVSNVLQTAMLLCHAAHDYPRAKVKLEEAIDLGTKANDDGAVYSARALLGQALLELNRKTEAATILSQIEGMVLAKKSVVIGDETLFLEIAREKDIDPVAVRRVASLLAPNCPDPEFAKRLQKLASS